ncbi:hypothetical protein D8S46_12145 [Salmonella enterica subsp. enterica serovar Newport]|nr:hypothetical protein [Salmonella enterica]EBZ2011880.1 hypothetical protein [Salmonella enterica subsp. enterica serovar Newport]ECF6083234.1 hypothetical protein [Salmonella enterica subsp. houtenae]EDF7585057.1 hypothetical protein [Salmonella enterica subsp. enterica serovar Newport]
MSNGKTKTQAGRLFGGNFDATGITLLPIGLWTLIGDDGSSSNIETSINDLMMFFLHCKILQNAPPFQTQKTPLLLHE